MKILNRKNLRKNLKGTVIIAGALFIHAISFNTTHADSHCKLVCKDMKNALQECLWEPKGCNNPPNKLGIPKSQLEQLINPKLVNPKLIIPKRKLIPDDEFIPGDEFKPKKLSQ